MSVIPKFTPEPYHSRTSLNDAFGVMEVADGKIVRVTMPDGTKIIGDMWEARFMTTIRGQPLIPYGKIYCNKVIASPLSWCLTEIAKLKDTYKINRFGCFSPRAKATNPKAVSLHSLGIAFDINPEKNPLQASSGPIVRGKDYDIPDSWIAIFESAGFLWGGHFKGRKDPMHFQYAVGV